MYNISSHESAFFKRFIAASLLQALEHEEKDCILPSAVYFNEQILHGSLVRTHFMQGKKPKTCSNWNK